MDTISGQATGQEDFDLRSERSKELPRWVEPEKDFRYMDAMWIALNAVASIAIVFMNK